MIFVKEILSDDNGRGSATRTATMMATVTMCAGLMLSITLDQEAIAICLAGALVTLAGGTYATARLSADSVQKKSLETAMPPPVTVNQIGTGDTNVQSP